MRNNQYGQKMKHVQLLLVALILICVTMLAVADGTAECGHEWVPFDAAVHGIEDDDVWLSETTETQHLYMYRFPTAVCKLCGMREYPDTASGSYVPHAYTVQQWEYGDKDAFVRIVMECGVCKYRHETLADAENIRQGNMDSCLFGGACDERKEGTLYSSGMILPMGNEVYPTGFLPGAKETLYGLIYDVSANTFRFAHRICCPVCGRPRVGEHGMPSTSFAEKWNGLQIMTEEYFLTVDMPSNLPYQMIDQIRKK